MILYNITETIKDTWSVHEINSLPVTGTAVWKYSWGWKCEDCGTAVNTTKSDCWHILKVKGKEKEGK